MNNFLNEMQKLRENLELAVFLVSKGSSEREAHRKIVESLVILSQMETEIKNNFSNCSLSEPGKSNSNPFKTENKIYREVEKVTRKLPKWFSNPRQVNSTILFSYLRLSEQNEKISLQVLKKNCGSVKDFYGNYNQMKNFGEKNHGKVFEERQGIVMLWEPVKDLILKLYNENNAQ